MTGWRAEDLDDIAVMYADPDVRRYVDDVPSRAECWRSVLALQAGHWALRGYGSWVLRRRRDERFVGFCGLWYPEGWKGVEIKWGIVPPERRRGYATEAAREVLDWSWRNVPTTALICLIAPSNGASAAIANRLGFAYHEQTTGDRGGTVNLYRLLRPTGYVRDG